MKKNIFSTLSKYAVQQQENYLTESFVYLLNLILEIEEGVGFSLLASLCGEQTKTWFIDSRKIDISTQLATELGIPDIVINIDGDKIVLIEVKHDSSLGEGQLESYFVYLEGLQASKKQLVLLTRSKHSIQETTLERNRFHHVCWYEISGWLSEAEFQDDVVQYLVEEFLDFLKEKDMSMEKITWEYIEGVPAMINLVNMIGTAISEVLPESGVKKTMGASWAGFYVEGIFIGFRYQDPLLIVFENDNGNNPTFKRDLYLEKAHFFSLSAGEQLECLIDFMNDSRQEYKNMDTG